MHHHPTPQISQSNSIKQHRRKKQRYNKHRRNGRNGKQYDSDCYYDSGYDEIEDDEEENYEDEETGRRQQDVLSDKRRLRPEVYRRRFDHSYRIEDAIDAAISQDM